MSKHGIIYDVYRLDERKKLEKWEWLTEMAGTSLHRHIEMISTWLNELTRK